MILNKDHWRLFSERNWNKY